MHNKLWHLEAVPAGVVDKLKELILHEALDDFYLAGGTALALHLGHRISRDLDFFSESFDEESVFARLQAMGPLSVISKGRETLHIHLEGVRISFLGYPYPLLCAPELFHGVAVADQRDIACMKLSVRYCGKGFKAEFYRPLCAFK